MYILFKAVNEQQLGIIQTAGRVLQYTVGYLPDTHTDIIEYAHLKPKLLSDDVALAWKFFGAYNESISVRPATLQNDQLDVVASGEPTGEKVKYYFTDADKANAVAFMKEVMRMMLDDIYDKRFTRTNYSVSDLEAGTWAQQKAEAEAYAKSTSAPTPMLSTLAQARGITVAQMAAKVFDAVLVYNQTVANLLAAKQSVEAEIKACTTIADCNRLLHNRFEVSMPVKQARDEGITTSARSDV
jgi:hypothetical protein